MTFQWPKITGTLLLLLYASSTPAQVVTQLADIEPGTGWSLPSRLTTSGDFVFFRATDLTNGVRLWKTDGTPAGTTAIFDPSPSSTDGAIRHLVDVDGTLFFWSTPSNAPFELWKTDGTPAGTVHVAAVSPTEASNDDPTVMSVRNGWLYFLHDAGETGELWKSDGVITEKVADLPSDSTANLVTLGGRLYFFVGHEIWTSDGTSAGTSYLIDYYQIDPDLTCPPWNLPYPPPPFPQCLFPPYIDSIMAEAGGIVFLALLENVGTDLTMGLWRTDGTPAGTTRIRSLTTYSFSMATMNDTLYLTIEEPSTGQELWKTDGTLAGTTMVADLVPGPASSNPAKLTAGSSTLWLLSQEWAGDQLVERLWTSDGTAAGTAEIAVLAPSLNTHYPFTNGDRVYLSMTTACFGPELWMSDGVDTGLRRVTNLDSGSGASNAIAWRANLGDSIVFSGRGASGYEPYVYDGGVPSGGCGDGILDTGEICDAGEANGQVESCCSCSCLAVPAGTGCNASGTTCGAQSCDGTSGVCPIGPAATCGDGMLDAGEDCDAGGGNGSPLGCCDCDCTFVPAGTSCRAGEQSCDPAELCTGTSAECPTDVGEPDVDLDEICDSVDACWNEGNRLRAKLSLDASRRKGSLRATFSIADAAAVDPVDHGFRILISNDGHTETIVDVQVPGGAYDAGTGIGWKARVRAGSSKWNYVNDAGFEGITKVSIKYDNSDGSVKLGLRLTGLSEILCN